MDGSGEGAIRLGRQEIIDRSQAAHRDRLIQLQRYQKAELAESKDPKNSRAPTISFPPNVVLLEAATRNDIHEVRNLLEKGVTPNLCNEDGLTALHQCCIDDFSDIVALLLKHGADANAQDSEGWTPLHAASACANLPLVQLLLLHGGDLLAVNVDGDMPYDICEESETLDYIETTMTEQGITQESIEKARTAAERKLLQQLEDGMDCQQRDDQGGTLLHVAAANGFARAIEKLLERSLALKARDNDGWEPIHAAVYWGQLHAVEVLLAYGASLKSKTYAGETPLGLCDGDEMRKRLLELESQQEAKKQPKSRPLLQRRTSSVSSRGKLERKASLVERESLYRKEREDEARLWQGGDLAQPTESAIPGLTFSPTLDHLPKKDVPVGVNGTAVNQANESSPGTDDGTPKKNREHLRGRVALYKDTLRKRNEDEESKGWRGAGKGARLRRQNQNPIGDEGKKTPQNNQQQADHMKTNSCCIVM
uniref:Protein phosphatase 1 regulatory subunit 16A n=1 Tax=Eptatretus burgeri TaxID=7764 RepID=A0A8C4NLT7_EPTBU